jgi:hypothetical protein
MAGFERDAETDPGFLARQTKQTRGNDKGGDLRNIKPID